uniref:Methyltransferase small domain-containing protein n=1 Tax=Eutreptiella gymnastica TaxID=73025 RepID=A0A7S1HUZ6_9EUGL|mmetsp:Transcript_107269/g.185069  ORF Transcript_107269/g.185069 Transcript_107269/m.185069 type:complete len:235 (+) Transcript_107269:117-821(+)
MGPKKKKYTPNTDHLFEPRFEKDVYHPCADSFTMMDALEEDLQFILHRRPTVCLEVGSGSGVITAFLQRRLTECQHHCAYLSCDINDKAAQASVITYHTNDVPCDMLLSDFGQALLPRLHWGVDVLLFNPPYVPTGPDELHSSGIEAAWAGGMDGMEVVDAFLPIADRLLAPQGLFYLVLIEQNKPKQLLSRVLETYGWQGEIIFRHQCGERLYILRFFRQSKADSGKQIEGQE